jgi:hypothetical protein
MGKISSYSYDTGLSASDYLLGNSATGPATLKFQISTLASYLATSGLLAVTGGIWGQELNRDTVTGVSRDTMSVAIAAKKYLYVIIVLQGTGGTISGQMLFNNDSGTNYSDRLSLNGAAETTNTVQSSVLITGAATYANLVFTAEIINIAAQEKLVSGKRWDPGTAGSANLPNRAEYEGKWTNTTNQITNVSLVNSGTGDFAIGSELIVLGRD